MDKRLLKIAVIVKSFTHVGGMERYAVEVSRLLAEKGHRVDIYSQEVDEGLLIEGMRYFLIPPRVQFSSVLKAYSLAKEAEKALSNKRYDIVHSHERSYCQDVLTTHCFSYMGSLDKYSFLRRIDQTLFSPRSWLYCYLESRQMKTDRLVAVSEVIKRDIFQYYKREKNVSVITPGVDIDFFSPERIGALRKEARVTLQYNEGESVILFVGSEFKRKGLDDLVPAIKSKGLRLLVVGRGENIDHYNQLTRNCGVKERVIFTGLSDINQVRKYYAAADLVVLPSKSEAFGMSILEGMACGLPVVVSDNSGVAALIEDGKNGFIRSNDQLDSFFSALPEKNYLQKVGLLARKTAEKFEWHNIADQYEELFYEVVNNEKEC